MVSNEDKATKKFIKIYESYKILKPVTQVFLAYLVSHYQYHEKKNTLVTFDDGLSYCYLTIEQVKKGIGLTRYEQETAIKELHFVDVFITRLKSVPAKRYFAFKPHKFKDLFGFNISLLDCGKATIQIAENQQSDLNNPAFQFVENQQTIYKDTRRDVSRSETIRPERTNPHPSPSPGISIGYFSIERIGKFLSEIGMKARDKQVFRNRIENGALNEKDFFYAMDCYLRCTTKIHYPRKFLEDRIEESRKNRTERA